MVHRESSTHKRTPKKYATLHAHIGIHLPFFIFFIFILANTFSLYDATAPSPYTRIDSHQLFDAGNLTIGSPTIDGSRVVATFASECRNSEFSAFAGTDDHPDLTFHVAVCTI